MMVAPELIGSPVICPHCNQEVALGTARKAVSPNMAVKKSFPLKLVLSLTAVLAVGAVCYLVLTHKAKNEGSIGIVNLIRKANNDGCLDIVKKYYVEASSIEDLKKLSYLPKGTESSFDEAYQKTDWTSRKQYWQNFFDAPDTIKLFAGWTEEQKSGWKDESKKTWHTKLNGVDVFLIKVDGEWKLNVLATVTDVAEKVATKEGFVCVNRALSKSFPEKIIGHKVAIIHGGFYQTSADDLNTVPGVVISENLVSRTLDMETKSKLIGFDVTDSNDDLLFIPLVGLKSNLGELLMKLVKYKKINVYGTGYELEDRGGKAGIWVDKIEVMQ